MRPHLPDTSFPSHLRLLLLAASAFAWVGCSSVPQLSMNPKAGVGPDSAPRTEADVRSETTAAVQRMDPSGPGTVFESIEAAASDALVYSYLVSRSNRVTTGEIRGGAIFPTEGGFSYDEPARSSDGASGRLRYRLQPTDLAHYRQFPADARTGVISATGNLHVDDRRVVDRRDPLKRPLYYLTPKRRIKVYLGTQEGDRNLGRIAFGVLRGATEVELTRLGTPTPTETLPLAKHN
ncbi:MAG: hypothetical protein AB8G23_08235 [Myxococcota bacterium]